MTSGPASTASVQARSGLLDRNRSDFVRFMKLFMNGSYGRNARGGIVELTCSSPGDVGVHVEYKPDQALALCGDDRLRTFPTV
jgi:hypothetical protein